MKTIAISIEENTVQRLDRLLAEKKTRFKNRSEFIREALGQFLGELEREIEEARERQIFRRERERLDREVSALISEQAKP